MIQIGNPNISTSLSPTHKTAIEAYFCPKIHALKKTDMVSDLKNALQRAYVILGTGKNLDERDTLLMLDELIKELKEGASTFTVQEVCLAIESGVKGKLNDLSQITQPVISVTNIIKWIWLWNDKVRREAIHEQRKFEDQNRQDEEEAKRIKGNAILDAEIEICYENWKSNNETLDHVPEPLRACYFRRLRERDGKLLEKEIMEQIKIIAESRHDTFEELPKLEQKYMIRERLVTKFEDERTSQVRQTAQSIALLEVFKKR